MSPHPPAAVPNRLALVGGDRVGMSSPVSGGGCVDGDEVPLTAGRPSTAEPAGLTTGRIESSAFRSYSGQIADYLNSLAKGGRKE